MDLSKAVSVDDDLYWQTKLPIDSNLISKSQRHNLRLHFQSPVIKQKQNLLQISAHRFGGQDDKRDAAIIWEQCG